MAGGFFSKIVAEHVRAFWNANIMMHDFGRQLVSLISNGRWGRQIASSLYYDFLQRTLVARPTYLIPAEA